MVATILRVAFGAAYGLTAVLIGWSCVEDIKTSRAERKMYEGVTKTSENIRDICAEADVETAHKAATQPTA